MMRSLEAVKRLKDRDMRVLKDEDWSLARFAILCNNFIQKRYFLLLNSRKA